MINFPFGFEKNIPQISTFSYLNNKILKTFEISTKNSMILKRSLTNYHDALSQKLYSTGFLKSTVNCLYLIFPADLFRLIQGTMFPNNTLRFFFIGLLLPLIHVNDMSQDVLYVLYHDSCLVCQFTDINEFKNN